MSIISFYNCYKRTPNSTRATFMLLFYRFAGEWTHECQTQAFAWQSLCVRFVVLQNGYDLCVDISVIRRNADWSREHDLRWKTRKRFRSRQGSFSRMISALAHELARLRLNAKRWKLSEASRTRGFSYLKVNNWWPTITATFLPLTWQFYANFIATWRYRNRDIGGVS